MRRPDSFAKALAGMRPGPCLRCVHFDRCASERLACTDYQRYTNFKMPLRADVDRKPKKRTYDHIFSNDQGESDGCM